MNVITKIDLHTLPCVALVDHRDLPRIPAIYFVMRGDDVLYVGRAKSLKQRWASAHPMCKALKPNLSGVFVRWLPQYPGISRISQAHIERAFIAAYRPPFNKERDRNA